MQHVCFSVFEFILQAHNLCRNRYWLAASNAKHSSIVLHQFCNHLDLVDFAEGLCKEDGSYTTEQSNLSGISVPELDMYE